MMSLLKIVYLLLKSIMLNLLLTLKIKERNLKEQLEMEQKNQKKPKKKNHIEKPTLKQLEKIKVSKGREKKEKWPFPVEKEDFSTGPLTEEPEQGKINSFELEEICGNLWVVLYQLGGVLKKGFEPLTDNEKNLLSLPSARIAVKYHVQDYMKDEFLLLGILGISISKRLIVKKKDDKDNNREKGEGKDYANSKSDPR